LARCRHDDDRADAQQPRRKRHGLGVVAARMGHDAAPLLLVGQLRQRVVRAADLERAGRLEALRLDESDVAETEQWRAHGDAANAPCGLSYVLDADQ